ncbi:MAG: S41 family peptidase [Aureispira sp.]|nr:S41 family peptidase [Aureispira sp.]
MPSYNNPKNNNGNPLSSREKLNIFLPLLLALTLAGGTWIGYQISSQMNGSYVLVSNNNSQLSPRAGKVDEILRFIDARYLEGIEMEKLEDAAIEGMLKNLDPHSSYIAAANLQGVNESLAGGFEGIGVEFFVLEDTVYIVGVIPDGPSDKAGMEVGDKIIMIGDSIIAGVGIKNKGVIDKLKGESGSGVDIKVKRSGLAELQEISITRGEIPMRSVDVSYMLDAQTGYIKVNRFSGKTYAEFMTALEALIEKDMKDLVIDLRQNPGGYLNAATDMLTQLFAKKKLLVYTEGRSYKRKEYNSNGRVLFKVGKVAVLINEGSASASEIMAGAIQDNDRGIVIGRRSFGKGLVQEQYELSDGSALRLTVARYFTPSGRLIQKPYEQESDDYSNDLKKRFESGELYHKDSIKISDSTKYYTTGGRVVYGGGGIIPDVFVPLDSMDHNPYFVRTSNYIPQFVYHYMDNNRQRLKQIGDLEAFISEYQVSDEVLEDFVQFSEEKGITRKEEDLGMIKSRLKLNIKAYVAQQLFRELGFYKVLQTKDPTIQKAIEELHRGGESTPSAMNESTI